MFVRDYVGPLLASVHERATLRKEQECWHSAYAPRSHRVGNVESTCTIAWQYECNPRRSAGDRISSKCRIRAGKPTASRTGSTTPNRGRASSFLGAINKRHVGPRHIPSA